MSYGWSGMVPTSLFGPLYGNPQYGSWSAWGRAWPNFADNWRNAFIGFYGQGPPWDRPAPQPNYRVPGGFNYSISAANLPMDPMKVVESLKPKIQEEMNRGFASAAQRLGQAGMLSSSSYTKALGDVSRKASNDLAAAYYNTMLQAAENQAGREMQARLANQQTGLSAWQTRGGWDVGLQQEAMRNRMDAWRTRGGWGQAWASMAADPLQRLMRIYEQQALSRDPRNAFEAMMSLYGILSQWGPQAEGTLQRANRLARRIFGFGV